VANCNLEPYIGIDCLVINIARVSGLKQHPILSISKKNSLALSGDCFIILARKAKSNHEGTKDTKMMRVFEPLPPDIEHVEDHSIGPE
jgi:hypothetical protein